MVGPPPPPASESRSGNSPMRVVFMGTPALAAHILERLVAASGNDFVVVAVVTRPDQPRNRGMRMEPSEVGAVAARHGLPILKPIKIRTSDFLAELKSYAPDLLVVAAYGRILPNGVLDAPHIMPINVHASLLPRHRGAAPIEGAILAGDRESGVTIMRVVERMDAGPILLQRSIPLAADETQGSLKDKLAELGASALLETLAILRRGPIAEIPQDEEAATYTAQIKKEDSIIDWSADAAWIERMTRAFDPWPVARTTLDGGELLVWRARVVDDAALAGSADVATAAPGMIVRVKPEPIVNCGSGLLALLEVQAAGRRRMAAADFFRGRRVEVGARLGQ